MHPPSLAISIVTYDTDPAHLATTLTTLESAVGHALKLGAIGDVLLWLIDNGANEVPNVKREVESGRLPESDLWRVVRRNGHGNIGYGAGHNLAILNSDTELHLVLNPDVELRYDAIVNAAGMMAEMPDLILLAPMVESENGEVGHLCKSYPTLLDLFLRGFAPRLLRRRFASRLARYTLSDINADERYLDPPLVSGSFMFMRGEPLRQEGGFDSDFFLYFEDYDLTRRLARRGRVVLEPGVRIRHFGGGAAGKGLGHIRMFVVSAWRFFMKHGWQVW